ncbi:MAG: hypothetical protein M5U09_27930 [Gammaproteobacteria bacterium]|nr:hypothetical protein [Gammaproteobacteria bacterium]
MTTEWVITPAAIVIGSGGVAGLVTILVNRRKGARRNRADRGADGPGLCARVPQGPESAKARIAELERDVLSMHRELEDLTRENIELRKKVARLESENQRLQAMVAGREAN